MKIAYFYADNPNEFNCSFWNCVAPAKAINKTGKHQASVLHLNEFVGNTENAQRICDGADIIIVERNFFGDTNTMMQYWKTRDKTVITIFDDAYDLMHPKNLAYGFWNKGEVKYKEGEEEKIALMSPKPLDQFKWGLRISKGAQVPSVNLARDWSKYTTTHYVHNYLDYDRYANAQPLHPHDGIVIGWAGSLSHYASFKDSGAVDALKKIANKFDNVKIMIGGDKRVFDLIDVSNDKKFFQPFVPEHQWSSLLKTVDIGVAPLAGEYDKRRSWVKALEYTILQVPWVATNYETYSELSHCGMMTENGFGNWYNKLETMVENYSDYKEKAMTTSYEFAVQQTLDNNVESVIIPLYEKLIKEPYL